MGFFSFFFSFSTLSASPQITLAWYSTLVELRGRKNPPQPIHPSIRLAPVKSDVSILPKSIRLLLFVRGELSSAQSERHWDLEMGDGRLLLDGCAPVKLSSSLQDLPYSPSRAARHVDSRPSYQNESNCAAQRSLINGPDWVTSAAAPPSRWRERGENVTL